VENDRRVYGNIENLVFERGWYANGIHTKYFNIEEIYYYSQKENSQKKGFYFDHWNGGILFGENEADNTYIINTSMDWSYYMEDILF